MNNGYTFTFVTIHYQCGHSAIRRILRHQARTPERWSYERCQHCTEQLQSRYNLRHYAEQEQEQESVVSA